MWISRTTGDERAAARRLLVRAGAALLRRSPAAVTVGHDTAGRPWVRAGAATTVRVSVSHSQGLVAVAASRHWTVGVDIEVHRPVPLATMARRWFSDLEAAWLTSQRDADRDEAFLLLWTAKEAVGKALGIGLRKHGLRRIMPLPDGDRTALRPLPGDGGLLVAHPQVRADAVLAVAIRDGDPDVPVVVHEDPDHDAALRNADNSRTSLPVVVRGSAATRCSVRGRL